jgi:carboxypeptidase PM20D1
VAEFVVNFRVLPGNTIADIEAHLKKVCEGFDASFEPVRPPQGPSSISPENTHGYQMIKSAIAAIYPDAAISPYVTVGGTDSYKYQQLSNNIYRFSPMLLNGPEQRSIHNQNEYISIENFGRMIQYFQKIMKDYDVKN